MKNKKSFSKRNPSRNMKGGDFENISEYAHIQPVQSQHLEVKVYNNNFDKAMTAFRALVQKERILSLYKEKQNFEKPSDKKRRKRNEMKRKLMDLEFKGDFKESKYKKKKSPEQSR